MSSAEIRYTRLLRSWREQRGLSKRSLAEAMAYHPSRVSHIEAGRQPATEEFTRQAEAALRTGGELWACWQEIAADRFDLPARPPERDLRTAEFVGWLAEHSAYSFEQLYGAVSATVARAEASPSSARHASDRSRRQITRAQVADALIDYYSNPSGPGSFYQISTSGTSHRVSILTTADWLTTSTLASPHEKITYAPVRSPEVRLSDETVAVAVRRLAAAESTKTVLVNNPVYRLVEVSMTDSTLEAVVSRSDFATFALTADLMEHEILGPLGTQAPGALVLPVRDTYLPDRPSAFDLRSRTCAGGALALTAIARTSPTGRPDYLLLVQERSPTVLNRPNRLAVIPKSFHQPIGDPADEASLSATLWREFEEELLGRHDLDNLGPVEGSRPIAPLHHQALSEPVAWLRDNPGEHKIRMECTGFGINMLTGNYEFACLIVIEDETWWERFGGRLQTNWETDRVHCISSLDTVALQELITDQRWSNEGLFAFAQGLRRLTETDPARRVAAPPIDLEI